MEVNGVSDMLVYARMFLGELSELPHERAIVVGLYGELGAGKTTFVQCIAKELGITEPITSPTFVIEKSYTIPRHPWIRTLVHIDAYRLESPQELAALSFLSRLKDQGTLVCVEWAEKVDSAFPEGALKLSFEVTGETSRRIEKK